MAASKGQKALGRGLGSLLGDNSMKPMEEPITSLPLQRVEPNPLQPRKIFDEEELQTLADSILQHGVIQPLTVRKGENGFYQIIAGERRWRAARLAGLRDIPVVVLDADDETAMELALIENLQRQDLNPMEEAMGYKQLMDDYGLTQEQVSQQVGKSRPAIANSLRLLALPASISQMIASGQISAGHGRALLILPSQRDQERAAQKIAALQLSVRQAESMCKSMAKSQSREDSLPAQGPPEVNYLAECEKTLSKHLGRGIKITRGKRKGKIELEFYDEEDLQKLYEALQTLKF